MRKRDNSNKDGLSSGDNNEQQTWSEVRPDDSGTVATHLFLAAGAEILQILQTLATADAAYPQKDTRSLRHALYARTAQISRYSARSDQELLLKTQTLFALIDAGMRDTYPGLAKSIIDDALSLCGKAGESLRDLRSSAATQPAAAAERNREIGPSIRREDAILLLAEMVESARKALVPPSQLTLFASPAAAFCTAAAMIACVERILKLEHGRADWSGTRVAVFGATGAVGFAAGVMTALEGAHVQLVAHKGLGSLRSQFKVMAKDRFNVDLEIISGASDDEKKKILRYAEVVLVASSPGIRVIDVEHMGLAETLTVVADTNLVPPSGVEGMELDMDGAQLPGSIALGVGPLTMTKVRRKMETHLLMQMLASEKPTSLNLQDVLTLARQLTQPNVDQPEHRPAS
jgi:methylene-tetrahydromethanopterin dehydrogenase